MTVMRYKVLSVMDCTITSQIATCAARCMRGEGSKMDDISIVIIGTIDSVMTGLNYYLSSSGALTPGSKK